MRSLPASILAKINKQNQTIYENANPIVNVIVARARSSVRDNTYFTIEKIRQKEGLSDVAVAARRLKPYGRPGRLYCIHLDNGLARTMHREYPDRLKAGWQNDFDIGNAKGVAMCFDGRWNLTSRKTWGLQTDLLPWLFWIDSSNNLQCQLWNEGTALQLATGVSKIDSIRGWVPVQAGHTDDQGVIIAYVKTDGKVYYRNYCLQDGGLTIWEAEQEVTELGTENAGIRLFRTNDFRVGFISENPTQNKMVLSKRNYAGMSVPPENLTANVGAKIDFIPIEFVDIESGIETLTASIDWTFVLLWGSPVNSIIAAENISITKTNEDLEEYQDWGFRIAFHTAHDMTNIDFNDFSLRDTDDVIFSITDIEKTSINNFSLSTSDFNNAVGQLKLKFNGSGGTKGEGGQDMDIFEILFTPTNLVPIAVEPPIVEGIYNE